MATILNTNWRVKEKTGNSPFAVGDTIRIVTTTAPSVQVSKNGSPVVIGKHNSTRNIVEALSLIGDEYWELMVSEIWNVIIDPSGTRGPKNVLYGISWKNTAPDAMGSWVCDPLP
jgi:hypothetical protein